VPDGIDATAAGLGPATLVDAATTMTSLLDQVTRQARLSVPFDPPAGLRSWTRSRLASVQRA
jgi:hypothetical protein